MQALGGADNQIPARSETVINTGDSLLLGFIVKINEHIPAEDQIQIARIRASLARKQVMHPESY